MFLLLGTFCFLVSPQKAEACAPSGCTTTCHIGYQYIGVYCTYSTYTNNACTTNCPTPTPLPTPTPVPSTVTGQVYIDYNGNGVLDGSDTPYEIAVVPVVLKNQSGTTIASGNTNKANGTYTITGFAYGTYSVALNPIPTNYNITYPTPYPGTITTAAIAHNATLNFGIQPPAPVCAGTPPPAPTCPASGTIFCSACSASCGPGTQICGYTGDGSCRFTQSCNNGTCP